MELTEKLKNLIEEIGKLPSIGPKTAERITLYLISIDEKQIKQLIDAIEISRSKLHLCPVCFNLTDKDICEICSNPSRDHSVICVVEEITDLLAIEKTNAFKGVYHVLHGSLDPVNHKNPEDLYIKELFERVRSSDIKEIILATNPDFAGEITATFLARSIRNLNPKLKISRIAVGLPKEAEIGLADSVTLSTAIKERKEYKHEGG